MGSLKINGKNSPQGTFLFCAVTGKGRLNEDKSTKRDQCFEYKVKIEVDEKDAADFMDQVDELIDSELGKGDEIVKLPYQTNEDYDGIPEGKVWIEAKCGTEFENSKGDIQEANVSIFDTRGDKCKLPEGTGVGKGSTGKVFGNVGTWDNKDGVGATLWLSGIQIADFTPYEFDAAPEEMEGSFKGFDKPEPELEKENTEKEEAPRRKRSSSRRREETTNKEETPRRRSRRRDK